MAYKSDFIVEVRQNREILLEKYGGIDGLHKHMNEERPKLEEQGWKFISIEDILVKKRENLNNLKGN